MVTVINFEEKRGSERINTEIHVMFTLNGNHETSHQGTTQNLSQSGLYMTTSYAPKIGDSIEMLMNINGKRLQSSVTQGKVVRSKFDKKKAQLFHVSVTFSKPHDISLY